MDALIEQSLRAGAEVGKLLHLVCNLIAVSLWRFGKWIVNPPTLPPTSVPPPTPLPATPFRRRKLPQPIRSQVWKREFGNVFCAVCPMCHEAEVTAHQFECGHILAHAEGGKDTVENLRPICATCNRSMGAEDMVSYEQRILAATKPVVVGGGGASREKKKPKARKIRKKTESDESAPRAPKQGVEEEGK